MAVSEPDSREAARALAPLALEILAEIMRGGGTDTARLAAAKEVLDRALGKARAADAETAPEGLTVVIRKFGEPDDEEGAAET